jgi:N-acyl-D-amino-acid deacylase
LLVGFKSEKLKPLTGKITRGGGADARQDPIETIMDLIAEDESRIDSIYFVMSEENVRKELAKPWISFGSGRSIAGAGGRFSEIESASARLWKFCARALANMSRLKKRFR